MKKSKNQQPKTEYYRCQFCEETSPAKDWIEDKCPLCKRQYDPILAQEMDDD